MEARGDNENNLLEIFKKVFGVIIDGVPTINRFSKILREMLRTNIHMNVGAVLLEY